MMPKLDITGQTFNQLTAVRSVRSDKKFTGRCWECSCSCGRIVEVAQRKLISREAKTCGHPSHRIKHNLEGKTFGRLHVLRRMSKEKGNGGTAYIWECRCDCGKLAYPRTEALLRGKTQSCGCLHDERLKAATTLPHGIAAMHILLASYRWGAKNRDLSWELNEEQFNSLVTSRCHYCGVAPLRKIKTYDGSELSGEFNGVDRKDSNIGYRSDNVVTSCKICQYGKARLPYDEFLQYLDRVRDFRQVPSEMTSNGDSKE